MYFINIRINIQILTNITLFYIDKKLANYSIYRYTTINREVIPMKQKCMWILFKMGLSLFTPDYMRLIGQKVCVKTLITLDIY